MWGNSKVEGLAEKAKVQSRVAEGRKGRRNGQEIQGAGGFNGHQSVRTNPILRHECGAFVLFFASILAWPPETCYSCGMDQKIPPIPLNSRIETKNAKKTQTEWTKYKGAWDPARNISARNFTSATRPMAIRPILNVRMRREFKCVTCATHFFQATPLRGRNCPG